MRNETLEEEVQSRTKALVEYNDLNMILEIRKNHSANISNFNFQDLFELSKLYIEKEIEEAHLVFNVDFSKATNISSVKPYVESILKNLISNAIKYRHPDRTPMITITTASVDF